MDVEGCNKSVTTVYLPTGQTNFCTFSHSRTTDWGAKIGVVKHGFGVPITN
jgi:hypothetical protein